MCKEDLRMGREFASRTFDLAPAGLFTNPVLPFNPKRVRLIFSGNGQETQFVFPILTGMTNGNSFALTPSHPVLILRIEDCGPLLYEKWGIGGSFTLGDLIVTEVVWEDE